MESQNNEQSFRDQLSFVGEKGKRNWIFARKPSGIFYTWRNVAGVVFLIVFFGLPFVKIHGEPYFMFNFLDRKFNIFGNTFWPQDSLIFFVAFISFFIFVILFTVAYGRIFCGWMCPQTIFTEIVFRKIEYWIDGDAAKQRKLKESSLTFEKLFKRTLKYSIYMLIAFIITNTLVAYLRGTDYVFNLYQHTFSENRPTFIIMAVFSIGLFFIYGKVRELVCVIICPYGRWQSVLLDQNSIVIAYDHRRGEPRGKKAEKEQRGDCIDCFNCVQVCPTGIDIRNGRQLECINCTACIDACNKVMIKQNKPKGLIKYASLKQIEDGNKFKFTGRLAFYSVILLVLLSFLTFLLTTRNDFQTTIIRTQGMLYQELDSTRLSNLYNIKIINKTAKEGYLTLKLLSPEGEIKLLDDSLLVKKNDLLENVFFIYIDKKIANKENIPVRIGIYHNGILIDTQTNTFMGKAEQ